MLSLAEVRKGGVRFIPNGRGPGTGMPTTGTFSEHNGNEARQTYHGLPEGQVVLVEAPEQFLFGPMQIKYVSPLLSHPHQHVRTHTSTTERTTRYSFVGVRFFVCACVVCACVVLCSPLNLNPRLPSPHRHYYHQSSAVHATLTALDAGAVGTVRSRKRRRHHPTPRILDSSSAHAPLVWSRSMVATSHKLLAHATAA